jgi:hypothetical protein
MSRSGKDALFHWTQSCTKNYPGVKIINWTTSWKDGLAFCALVHHFNPSKIKFFDLNATNALDNLNLAFKAAHEDGVPKLLDAEDMLIPKPEPLSIITYVSS